MGLSLQDRVALLPAEERNAWLAELPDYLLDEMARGEWWWVSRPEQVPPSGSWMVCLALAGRGYGKALARETPIPTPSGWTTMGKLSVGDQVFDEAGVVTTVTGLFDRKPKKAYRVTFSDGTWLDADGDHQWVTWDYRARKALNRSGHDATVGFPDNWPQWRSAGKGGFAQDETGARTVWKGSGKRSVGPEVLTTDEMFQTQTFGPTHTNNHAVPTCLPLDLPDIDLPIDPWILGYWLGNGSKNSAEMCMHTDDEPYVRQQVTDRGLDGGLEPGVTGHLGRPGALGKRFSIKGLIRLLKEAELLGNKHIPREYFRASIAQRKALLAGLMDSDGHLSPRSKMAQISTVDRQSVDDILELVRSLGGKPVESWNEAEVARERGYSTRGNWLISWRSTFNPMWNPRKAANFVPLGAQALRRFYRMVTSVERIKAPTWMRCITVDSKNSLYLAGDGMIPTHNTRAGAEWIVSQVLKHPYDSHGVPTEWLVVAETLSDARTICMEGPAGVIRVLERRKIRYRFRQSPRPMILFPDGAKIYTEGADDPDVGRGYNCSGSWLDEIAKWKYPKASWDSGIMPSLRADLIGDHPRAFVTTTPKPIDLLQEWVKRNDETIHVIRGSTFDNSANLSQLVIQELKKRYDGTLVGRQELYGEMIEGFEGALFRQLDIENNRLVEVPDLINIVVGVDPSLTGEDDEMGIVVVGRDKDNHMYVLEDASLMGVGRTAALDAWRVVARWGADKLVCEVNLGKRWMQQVFNDAYYELVGQGMFEKNTKPPLIGIDTKIGKKTRGEPVAMRNEQGRLHHVGIFPELEAQMATFTSWGTSDSPDRLDALVHACRFLIEGEKKQARISSPQDVLSSTLQSLWAEVGSYRADF